MLNLGIIIVVIGVGVMGLEFSQQLSERAGLTVVVLDLIIGAVVLALCIPSGFVIWRHLNELTEELLGFLLPPWRRAPENVSRQNLKRVMRNSLVIILMLLPMIWFIPLGIRLFLLGGVFAPLVTILLAVMVAVVAFAAFQIHGTFEDAFRRTFLGTTEHYRYDEHQWDYLADDSHLYSHDGNYYDQVSALED